MSWQDERLSAIRRSPRTLTSTLRSTDKRRDREQRDIKTRECKSRTKSRERNSTDNSFETPVLHVRPVGHRSSKEGINVISLKQEWSAAARGLRFSKVQQSVSDNSIKQKDSKLGNEKSDRDKPSNKTEPHLPHTSIIPKLKDRNLKLVPYVCLNDLNAISLNKMKRANLTTPKTADVSPKRSPKSSVLPQKLSQFSSTKNRSPQKNYQETPTNISTPVTSEMTYIQRKGQSFERSPTNISPRLSLKQSPPANVNLKTEAGKPKELSPRELDAIKTLRKLKSRSPQKKAITNEMRKSACHTKQNERRDSLSAPGHQKQSPNSMPQITVPRISLTSPKEEVASESPKRARRGIAKSVPKQVSPVAIKTDEQTSPRKRGRKKKSSISSPDKLDLCSESKTPCDKSGALKVESRRSTKRVRSPSARYTEDIFMYPWDSPRKKQSPKKSEADKSPTPGGSKEYQSSSLEESSSDDSSDLNSEDDSSVSNHCTDKYCAQNISRDSILCAARVLNFDEVDVNEYSKIGQKPLTLDRYKSFLHTSQENKPTDLIGLPDLIAKVSSLVEKPNEDLINLFGTIKEPDYCDESITCKAEEEAIKEDQDRKSEAMQATVETGKVGGSDSAEDKDNKPKNDSDLDSTIEYAQDSSPPTGKDGGENGDISFSGELRKVNDLSKLIVCSSDFDTDVSKNSDKDSSSVLPERQLEQTEIIDQVSDGKKARNLFDIFDEKDSADNKCGSETDSKNSISVDCESSERASEKPIPDMLDTVSGPTAVDESVTLQDSDNCVDSKNQQTAGLSSNFNPDKESKYSTAYPSLDNRKRPMESKSSKNKENAVMLISETRMPAVKEVLKVSDVEAEDKNNNSSGNKTDRSGFEQLKSSPRCVPRFSTVSKTIFEPSPLAVLKSVEKEITDKHCAFISDKLEDYLKPFNPAVGTDADVINKSNKACARNEMKSIESPNKLEQDIRIKQEASDNCVVDVVAQVHKLRPDLDEIDEVLFISFSSEEAMLAHVELEKKLDWLDEINLKRMKHLMNKEKVNENDITTPSKSPHTKQSLRGVPGRVTKYRKLLKQEYDIILKAKENRIPVNLRTKTPEKTADITKIKGWKKKYANKEELQQATGLHFSESGKLHWKTEERILKQFEPEDVKEIGLDLKKKRRKLVHYTKRKGESKTDKPKHSETFDEVEEPAPLEPFEKMEILDDENSKEASEKIPYHIRYSSQHKYGKRKMFVKQMKMDAADENILKKLGSQKIAVQQKNKGTDSETKPKKSKAITYVIKLSHTMALAALSALDKRLMAKAKTVAKLKAKKREMKEKIAKVKHLEKLYNEAVHEVKDRLESYSESEVEGSDGYEEIPEDEIKERSPGDDKKEGEISEKGDNGSKIGKSGPDQNKKSSESKACDQPGCRYGCICHLYKFSEKDEKEDSDHKPPCDKEYCRLGCICDSIDTKTEDQSHCGKPDCMFGCKCKPEKQDQEPDDKNKEKGKSKDGSQQKGKKGSKKKRQSHSRKSSLDDQDVDDLVKENDDFKGDNADWEPPAKKRRDSSKSTPVNKYAGLPRRESRYRVAKNLDAVTRKAKQVYESSEMYVEQKVRRRKSDPVVEMVSDGDFLDNLPPDWRDTLDPTTSTSDSPADKTAESQKEREVRQKEDSSVQPQTHTIMDTSEDEEEGDISSEGPESCARTKGYDGQRKCGKQSLFLVEDSPESQTVKMNKRSFTKKDTELIDLVDSDCEVTEVKPEKPGTKPREMTVSEKLKMMQRKQSQEKAGNICQEIRVSTPPQQSKWKTQMVCLKAKKKLQPDNQASGDSEIKLLEIISNCNWEADRANMLSKISHIISRDYSTSNIVLWNNYALQFLPQAEKPATIPHELKAKLPESMFSIRIRVTQNLSDIEQTENNVDKDSDGSAADVPGEGVKSLSNLDQEQYENLRNQKKLIDKIRFAEKLKDLIEQEEKKGPQSSKFSISKDGIEKALKRYKTQLWRAYTGNSNMTISQLKDAVMKAKSSNYTEKINQAITAIEKKVQEGTSSQPESSQPSVHVTGSAGSVSVHTALNQSSTTTVVCTSTSNPVTSTSVVKSGSDLKTLSTTAKARIEANQGIIINGPSSVGSGSKGPMTKLITQGGKRSEIYLVPVGVEEGTSAASLPGATSLVNLQPFTGYNNKIKMTSADVEAVPSMAASEIPTTSTSASTIISTSIPKATAPITSPSVVRTLASPVMSNIGAPMTLKPVPVSAPSGMPMRMLVNGHSENVGVASPVGNVCPAGSQPMLVSGTLQLNGQRVWAVQKVNIPQSSQETSSVNTTLSSSVSQSICNNSSNSVTPAAAIKMGIPIVDSPHPDQTDGVSSNIANGQEIPVTLSANSVNGPHSDVMSNPFYPPVRYVSGNARALPDQFVPIVNAPQLRPAGKTPIGRAQPVSFGGPQHMVPLRVLNPPPNTSNTIVQLIPVSSTALVSSSNSTLKSVSGNQAEFIAVPVHFEKSQGNMTGAQNVVNPVNGKSAGMKTHPRSISPGAAVLVPASVAGVRPFVPPVHRPISPSTGFVPLSAEKSPEECDMKLISILPSGTCKIPNPCTSKNADQHTVNDVSRNGNNLEANKGETQDTNLAAVENVDGKLRESEKRNNDECPSTLEGKNAKKRKKSYAQKLDDLNKLDKVQTFSGSNKIVDCVQKCPDVVANIDSILSYDSRSLSGKNKITHESENISSDISSLNKTFEKSRADIHKNANNQPVGDTDIQISEKIADIDSVDGDINLDSSQSVLSESGDSTTMNINTVIDNTKNAGIQIASVLGNTLDSPVIQTSQKEGIELSDKAIADEDTKAVLNNSSVNLDTCSQDGSQDSDGCLIIDENYISPAKRTSEIQNLESVGRSHKKRKLEDVLVDGEKSKAHGCSSSGNKEETSAHSDILQICIDDSEDDLDVETVDQSSATCQSKTRKTSQDSVHSSDSLQNNPSTTPDHAFLLRRQFSSRQRRKEMKKMLTKLAQLVLKYNPDVKKKCIRFLTDSTVQLSKLVVLESAKDLIESLHEEYQCLHELFTDGEQYHETLKQKLKTLTDSFVDSGVPEVIVNNFLKSVASSAKLMENTSDSSSTVGGPKHGRISPVDLTKEDTDETEVVEAQHVKPAVITMPAEKSLLNTSNREAQKVCVLESNTGKSQNFSDSVINNPTLNSGTENGDHVIIGFHENKSSNVVSFTKSGDLSNQTTVYIKDSNTHCSTDDLTDGSKCHKSKSNRKLIIKPCDNQENCDNQSKIQTSKSNDSSSQSSSQSDKIILLDSSTLENSAAKTNHSELLILENSENDDKGEVHNLEEILDEWSAEICSL